MCALPHSVSWILQQATTDPQLCQRLLDTWGQVWVSLLRGHCFFLLGPCLHKVLSVPSKSLFPQSCVSSGSSMGGVNGDLLQEGLCHTQVCCTQSPCPCGRPLLTCTSTGDAQTLEGRSGSVSVEYPGVHKVLFEPSKCLWWVWGLTLNAISPLLLSCWVFSFALGQGYIFLGGIQHSPDNGCSAMSCNFGVLAGEDELTSFYSAILNVHLFKAMVLSVVMYGYKSWTIKKAEHWRIDAFELFSWRRLLRVSWTAMRSNTVLVTKTVLAPLGHGHHEAKSQIQGLVAEISSSQEMLCLSPFSFRSDSLLMALIYTHCKHSKYCANRIKKRKMNSYHLY